MLSHWDAIKSRHAHLMARAASPSLSPQERRTVAKELSFLDDLFVRYEQLEQLHTELRQTNDQLAATREVDMRQLFEDEALELQKTIQQKTEALEEYMAPPDDLDDRSIYLEIRAGTGGQEASLFVADLLKMYTNYALKHGWKVSIEDESTTDLGGYREVVLHISGKNAYGRLKYESGVHRVQRVPATETQGRVHTSTATVAVMPEAEEVDVQINPSDLRIDVFRSSGAGGQHVNTTDSAVRITHIPTGVVSTCQDERSQHKNKAKALKMLQSRILAAQMEQQQAQMSKMRKDQIGGGARAEKVRTYNYPQNRVTDHQVDVTLKKLDMVMMGDLDDILNALAIKDREQRRERFLERVLQST